MDLVGWRTIFGFLLGVQIRGDFDINPRQIRCYCTTPDCRNSGKDFCWTSSTFGCYVEFLGVVDNGVPPHGPNARPSLVYRGCMSSSGMFACNPVFHSSFMLKAESRAKDRENILAWPVTQCCHMTGCNAPTLAHDRRIKQSIKRQALHKRLTGLTSKAPDDVTRSYITTFYTPSSPFVFYVVLGLTIACLVISVILIIAYILLFHRRSSVSQSLCSKMAIEAVPAAKVKLISSSGPSHSFHPTHQEHGTRLEPSASYHYYSSNSSHGNMPKVYPNYRHKPYTTSHHQMLSPQISQFQPITTEMHSPLYSNFNAVSNQSYSEEDRYRLARYLMQQNRDSHSSSMCNGTNTSILTERTSL